jgi:DnaK suppressor protein
VEGPGMNKKQLNEFKILLQNKKSLILQEATKTMNKELKINKEEMADTMDRSAVETDNNFLLRLRDRERKLLKKINDSLNRIEKGSFGVCNLCGEDIGEMRLNARPMAMLCIKCKEDQEKKEKLYG